MMDVFDRERERQGPIVVRGDLPTDKHFFLSWRSVLKHLRVNDATPTLWRRLSSPEKLENTYGNVVHGRLPLDWGSLDNA